MHTLGTSDQIPTRNERSNTDSERSMEHHSERATNQNASIKTTSWSTGPGAYEAIRGAIVLTLVRKARNRWLRNEMLAQGANAVSAALAAVILLLLLGTQILDWRWAAFIPFAAL